MIVWLLHSLCCSCICCDALTSQCVEVDGALADALLLHLMHCVQSRSFVLFVGSSSCLIVAVVVVVCHFLLWLMLLVVAIMVGCCWLWQLLLVVVAEVAEVLGSHGCIIGCCCWFPWMHHWFMQLHYFFSKDENQHPYRTYAVNPIAT